MLSKSTEMRGAKTGVPNGIHTLECAIFRVRERVRQWSVKRRTRRRLAQFRRQYLGPSIYWARVVLTVALWALVLWALWPTPDPPVASKHWAATFVPHSADLS